jgi:hypothetical protein
VTARHLVNRGGKPRNARRARKLVGRPTASHGAGCARGDGQVDRRSGHPALLSPRDGHPLARSCWIPRKAAASPRVPPGRRCRSDLTPTTLAPGSPDQRRCVTAPCVGPRPPEDARAYAGSVSREPRAASPHRSIKGGLSGRPSCLGCRHAYSLWDVGRNCCD